MRNKFFLIIGILLAIGLIWFKLSLNQQKVDKEIQEEKAVVPFAVEAIAVKTSDFSRTTTYPGLVETTGTVNVVSETDGRVVTLNIQNGSTVHKGQVIAVLESPMKAPTHQIHQIDYNKAKTDFERYSELYKQNNATSVEFETARHAMETAERQLRISQSELNREVVKAPISGVVTSKLTNAGDYLSPGSPIAVIVPLNQLEVRFQVPEKEIPNIKPAQRVRFTADAYPNQYFEGTVSAIIPNANQAKTFPVLIKVSNNQHGITLMGGMTVNVEVEVPQETSILSIPRTAVRGDLGSPQVWLISDDKKAVQRSFQMGREIEDQVEVISGLNAGDVIVTKGQSNITEGISLESVKIIDNTNIVTAKP